jgi:hypothetical protein
MLRKLTLAALLLLQLTLIAVGARMAWESEPVLDGNDGVVDVDPARAGMLTSLEEGFEIANEEALEVNPTARLVLVTQQVDWPLDPPPPQVEVVAPGGWLTFVFSYAPDSEPGSALSLEIDRLNGSTMRAVDVSWEEGTERRTLPLGQLAVESNDAILAVEEAGGTAFRAECPERRAQTIVTLNLSMDDMTLARMHAASPVAVGTPVSDGSATPTAGSGVGSRGTAVWVVTYSDRGANDNVALVATVDAVTGDVLSLEHDFSPGAAPCGNAT